jgi:hypothetical protein
MTSIERADTVIRLTAELEQATADADLYARLTIAKAEAKRLAVELDAAREALAEAEATEVKAASTARLAAFHDLTVTETGDGHVLHRSFEITITRLEHDGHNSVPVPRTTKGFEGLSSDAFTYLIEARPERIPGSIMALAPDDPWEAFEIYLMGLRRGYLKQAA